MLGRVDEVEIEEELRDSSRQSEDVAVFADAERNPGRGRPGEHRGAGDGEAVGDRPGRWNRPDLVADHRPGRTPNEGDEQEGEEDPELEETAAAVHSARIAAASESTASGSESQA